MLKLLPFLLVTLAASPALAGATPWQDIAPGVKARLISNDTITNGMTLAGLELDMPQDTKTYWRVPGETGIPTEFSFDGTTGVDAPAVEWPYPQIDRSDGYLDYVYYGHIVLPIALKADGGEATLATAITLGICSDMCVPAHASFSLPLSFAKPDVGQAIRLSQAEALTPVPWDGAADSVGPVTSRADGLAIAGLDPAIQPDTVIADLGDPAMLFETPQKSPDGPLWTLKLLGGAATKGLEGRSVQLTFMTAKGPYVVTRQIAAPAH
ncbi:MAG: protein-disulfide reductase DsbD domain-containing protein [Devosia sp.]